MNKKLIENIIRDYNDKNILLKDIAKKYNFCVETIRKIVRSKGVLKRKHKYDEKLICKMYLEGKAIREIAEEIDGSKTSIASIVKNNKISRKREPRKSIIEKNTNRCPEFTKEFLEYLDGLLISDGHLSIPDRNAISSGYTQTCVNREWLEEIQKIFELNGIMSSIGEDKRDNRNVAYVLRSLRYDQFFHQYHRWYKNNIKIVPKDIVFSKKFLTNWVYGDGTTGKTELRFCCDSFSEKDIEFLLDFFYDNGYLFKRVKMGLAKNGKMKYRISLNKTNGVQKFFRLLEIPLPCFKYKWI